MTQDPATVTPVPALVTVHCFFGCPHTELADPAVGRSEAMEQHYRAKHRAAYSRAVGHLI